MVSSYNSVSLDPPLVLWSLAKTSRSLEAFREAKAYVIHVLGRHQQALIARTRHDVPGSRSNF